MIPNEKRDKSWAQEQLEDPEMFEAFCRELKREAARRGECRALLSLARWASKTATAAERAPVEWYRADEHYAKVDSMRAIASECRRRAKKGKR